LKFHLRSAVTALFVVASCAAPLAQAATVSGQGTWETTLQGRDLDGNLTTFEAYYDTDLNITWLANANYAGTVMSWPTANAWAAGLNPYGSGITGWRLPTVIDKDGPDADALGNDGCYYAYSGTDCGYNVDTATGEMAHLFYATLGNKAYYSTTGTAAQPGWGLTNTGPFALQAGYYWSATEYAPGTGDAWFFHFNYGNQVYFPKANEVPAWAVHSGDVGAPSDLGASTVPVPATLWLFGSGLIGLLGMSRKRRR
jgi:hypothetical protein